MNKVSVVIPVFNQLQLTMTCLKDLLNTSGVELEIIVINDGSTDNTAKVIPMLFPDVKLLHNEQNLGFAKTVNKGIEAASHDLICLLNNDIRLPNTNWLQLMISFMSKFDLTAPAGGRLDNRFNYVPGEAKSNFEKFSFLVGWALLVKRKVFDTIGLFSEKFGKGFFEDVLFSFAARKAGFKLGITTGTDVQHLYHQTFKQEGININEQYNKNRKIFLKLIKDL